MEVKFGLFSCDSHAQLDRDAWTARMSNAQWGDRIPQIVEVKENGQTADRWMVNGKVRSEWVCNCPAAMEGGVERGYYPRRWEEVPKIVYDPAERLKALDDDRVDGEVLYPNGPVSNFAFLQADAAFELACVQAYNDALAEWREVSDRYVPVAIIPYMSEIDVVVARSRALREARPSRRGHAGRAGVYQKRFEAHERSVLGTALGLLPGVGRSHALAWLVGFGPTVVPAKVGRIHQKRIAHGFDFAPVRDTGATDSQFDLLRHSRPLSAAQLGLRRNRLRLGQLRARSVAIMSGNSAGYGRKASKPDRAKFFGARSMSTSGTKRPASSCASWSASTTSCGSPIIRISRRPIRGRGASSRSRSPACRRMNGRRCVMATR